MNLSFLINGGVILKIGIMGGTFDPIHFGHLIMAEYARETLDLDKVIFVPTGIHPLKVNKAISPSHIRVEMISLAIESNSCFEVSTIEIDKEGISYTIDTLRLLKGKYKSSELYFILGTDILFEIEKWKDFRQLSRICKLVLFHRAGDTDSIVEDKIRQLKMQYGLKFEKIESPKIEISSTEIRNRVFNNKSIKYMLPQNVEEYIAGNNLYKGDTNV